MKLDASAIKRRLYGLAMLPTRFARARYFRGHGVHSPFVYRIVRQVFMQHRLLGGETALYDALLRCGTARHRALQLQNLATYCEYGPFAIDAAAEPCDLCILTAALDERSTRELVRQASGQGATVAVMTPYRDRERAAMCRRLVAEHCCTSVDNRGYLLFFNDKHLPKQHYRI